MTPTPPGWRDAVMRSRLPNHLRLLLITHARRGRHRFHDDTANLHGVTRARLAHALGRDESTVRRSLRDLEAAGWLILHSPGVKGRQAVYHYWQPHLGPVGCPECDTRKGVSRRDQ